MQLILVSLSLWLKGTIYKSEEDQDQDQVVIIWLFWAD